MLQVKKYYVVLYVMLCVVVSFSQINLLSDNITFRTSNDKGEVTNHYGDLNILGLGTSENSVLYSKYESTIASDKVAVLGRSEPQPYYGIGGKFYGGWKGVLGISELNGNGTRYGGCFFGRNGSSSNYGVLATAYSGSPTSTAYGVYASGSGSGTSYAGYFNGNVHVTGTFTNPSDAKFKKDISLLNGSLDKIMKLKPKKYFYKTEAFKSMKLPKKKSIGLIAQEVETVYPDLVSEEVIPVEDIDENGEKIQVDELKEPEKYKSINYLGLIPVLINAIQEQQEEIDMMKRQLGID